MIPIKDKIQLYFFLYIFFIEIFPWKIVEMNVVSSCSKKRLGVIQAKNWADWLILTVCQHAFDYFMPTALETTFIFHSYKYFLCVAVP